MPDDESIATSAARVAELREPCRATAMMSSPVKAAATPATTAREARADGRTANCAILPTTVRGDATTASLSPRRLEKFRRKHERET